MMHKERGTAIIVALFITALVAAISVAMMIQVRTDTRRTELLLNQIQADLYADGSVYWAIILLTNNLKNQKPGQWVDRFPIIHHDIQNGATITASIEDAQGLLNLNTLADPVHKPMLSRLIKQVAPETTQDQINEITLGVVDWISRGLQNSAFDQYYSKQQPAFQAPHHPMASVSELRNIKGMNAKLFNSLAPFITALPQKVPININTAPLSILLTLSEGMNTERARALINARTRTPWTDIRELDKFPVVKAAGIPQNILTVISQYFLLKTTVTLGDQQETLITLLSRTRDKDNQVTTGIVWQSKGTL